MGLIKTGYKQTEIGIIPDNWELKTYGECFDFLSTATYSRDELTDNDEVKYVHYGDIHTKWNFILDISKSILPTIPANKVKNYSLIMDGDIIMADASEDYEGVGKSVEVINVNINKVIAGLHTYLLRDRNQQIESGFKAYLHINSLVKRQFDRLATGMKVYGVSKNNLKTVLIPLPKQKSEQTAIATTLIDVDTLIGNLEKLISKKRNIRQGMMQLLLTGKRRLPGFSTEWEVKRLEEIADFNNGKAHEKYISEAGDYIVVNSKFISTEGEIRKYTNHFLCPAYKDEILMVMSDVPNGKAIAKCFYVDRDDTYTVNQRICCIKTRGAASQFLYYLLNRNPYFLSFDDGAKQTNLRKEDILKCELSIPKDLIEQEKIATIVHEMESEIAAIESKLFKYRMIKRGMMQTLLTGKIRLI